MNTKDSVSYLLIIGMIFSLLWFLTSFWISLGISSLIGIVLFIKTVSVSQAFPSSLSFLKLPPIRTIIMVLVVAVIIVTAIIWVKDQGPKSANHFEVRLPEEFNDNETSKNYGYNRIHNRDFNGDFVIADEKLQVLGGIRLTNTDLLYEYPTFKFSIGRLEAGEVITISVLLESEHGICPFSFTVKGPTIGHSVKRVEIGVNEHDQIWVKIDNSQIDVGNYQFDTSTGSFDFVIEIISNKVENPENREHPRFFRPSFTLDNIVLG